ncbi:MAG: SAM-dependent chlorinase/fluorinase [Dehalococcoidales bacterium]|nr:SAM-dependent chlorinase/fluorinase [Dehalococcoidales bacterium]
MNSIITLTSDFGLYDGYVASMKGVILGINPEVTLVDICHTTEPHNINQAAFVLSTSVKFFPSKTIHLIVVDPGVGTKRPAIILKTPHGCFITPDNGSLSYVLESYLLEPVQTKGPISIAKGIKPGISLEAVQITNPRFWRTNVSPTFHGRDIFAPVAAALSLGFLPVEFGEPVNTIEMFPLPKPDKNRNGSLTGHIIYIDKFGNLITNVHSGDIPVNKHPINIQVGAERIVGLSRTYADKSGLLAYIGSNEYMEIAVKGGSAASVLNVKIGDEIQLSD